MIFINGRFLDSPVTGVQRYSIELLNALDGLLGSGRLAPADQAVCLLTTPGSNGHAHWKNIPAKKTGRLTGNLWEQVDLPAAIRDGLLFSPANIGPYFSRRQVVTIHDPSVFAVPQAYSPLFRLKYRAIFNRLAKTAAKVITVSEFSRHELAYWCGIPVEKIEVVYEGKEHILRQLPDNTVFERLGIGARPFFLAVGSNSIHKNFASAVQAFENANLKDVDLVITGGSFSKVFQESEDDKTCASLIKAGYVSDAELRALYNQAVGLVFPSLYEGFGLPPLEAMACGCPVISSNAASMPEVCEDAVLYCDPQDVPEMTNQMRRLFSSADLQSECREKGLLQAGKFSWDTTAEKVWEILQAAQD